jgi:hypothetical protein
VHNTGKSGNNLHVAVHVFIILVHCVVSHKLARNARAGVGLVAADYITGSL